MSVESPCTNVCRMDPNSGLCEGCFRNVDEITVWSTANDCMKRAILAQIDKRRAAAAAQQPTRSR